MSFSTITTQWCLEDSSGNVSRQVQDVFEIHVHYSVQRNPQGVCLDRSRMSTSTHSLWRIPQGKCDDMSRMSFSTMVSGQGMCPDRSRMSLKYMIVQKVYLLQQSQILGNPTQCLLRHFQAYKSAKGRATKVPSLEN